MTTPILDHAPTVSAPPTPRRGRLRALLALLLALAFLGAAPAFADTTPGSERDPDRASGWLEGPALHGALVLPDTGRAAIVTVTAFRGDAVTARAWDQAAGGSREIALHARDLVGLYWFGEVCPADQPCAPITYRVVSGAPDHEHNTMPGRGSNRDVWLYQVEYTTATRVGDPAPADWINACSGTRATAGSRDAASGLFVGGRWADDGTWTPGGYTFSCPDGVIAKCVRSWGYKPWKSLHAEGHGRVSLRPLHLACVRAARADYCGDGVTHTRDGTFVDMADRYGFNRHEHYDGHLDESAFDENGALWVHAPRWPTGERAGDHWRFPTCTRRASANPAVEPLIRIRSATYLAR